MLSIDNIKWRVKKLRQPGYLSGQRLPNLWNDIRLLRLRDIHKGQRAFLVGNGPSLRVEDLDLLRDEITFASNRIYLAFDKTIWRPTYYTVTDPLVAERDRVLIDRLGLKRIYGFNMWNVLPAAADCAFVNPPLPEDLESWNLIKGSRNGYSVTSLQIKLAWWMGIHEIYTIGIDFSYPAKTETTNKTIHNNVIVRVLEQGNHFDDRYYKAGDEMCLPRLEIVENEFAAAKSVIDQNGGRIYNASRKTALKVWDRVVLEDVLLSCNPK